MDRFIRLFKAAIILLRGFPYPESTSRKTSVTQLGNFWNEMKMVTLVML